MKDAEKAVRTAHDQDRIEYLNGACNFKNIGALLAELDSLRKDAQRLDWLDSVIDAPILVWCGEIRHFNLSEEGLRHAIDAAMGDVCK